MYLKMKYIVSYSCDFITILMNIYPKEIKAKTQADVSILIADASQGEEVAPVFRNR